MELELSFSVTATNACWHNTPKFVGCHVQSVVQCNSVLSYNYMYAFLHKIWSIHDTLY